MLRFIYGLPYTSEEGKRHDEGSLVPHALVYVVAEKYQMPQLKDAAHDALLSIFVRGPEPKDLVTALRIIFAGTLDTDDGARPLRVKYCVSQPSSLWKTNDFNMLLNDCAELGAAMFAHAELGHGSWGCTNGFGGHLESSRLEKAMCASCFVPFHELDTEPPRGTTYWECRSCGNFGRPICGYENCGRALQWVEQF